jgi:hypothetical protein
MGLQRPETRSRNESPAERKAEVKTVMGEAAERIGTRLAALQDRYREATGRPAPEWLSPAARARLASLREGRQAQPTERET